jgi:4-amino-4-deoxy-L-arabinose transferase-like glycosyltransferase
VFIFIFFSKSDSKLASYILPIFPALALLIGERLSHISSQRTFWLLLPVALLAFLALLMSPYSVTFAGAEFEVPYYRAYAHWVSASTAVWLVGTALGLFWLRRSQIRKGILAVAFSGLILAQGLITGHESLAPLGSTWALAQQIKPYNKPTVPFYSIALYDQTLPFYLKRTLTLVDYQDEMAFGISQEPDKWIPTVDTFVQVWNQQPEALAIMDLPRFEQLKAVDLPMQLIARDEQYFVIKKP